jgi:hypothetical protein
MKQYNTFWDDNDRYGLIIIENGKVKQFKYETNF